MLKSKSITLPKEDSDGLRICVMRKIHPEYEFDLWWPSLAPSLALLEKYVIHHQISWPEFSKAYLAEQENGGVSIAGLVALAQTLTINGVDVTLLCGELSYHHCHRQLIREQCLQLDPAIWPAEPEPPVNTI
jgi:uncharacterized protein YeaO (DUF488 family)